MFLAIAKLLKTWWPGTELNRRRQPFRAALSQSHPADSKQSNPAQPLEKPALSATKRNHRPASVCSPKVEAAAEPSPDSHTLVPPESSKLTIKPGDPSQPQILSPTRRVPGKWRL